MKTFVRSALVLTVAATAMPLAGCHRSKTYDANVEVTRFEVVRKDETGAAVNTDVEISYAECPGTQTELIRGGREFSECVKNFKVGDKVKVKLEHVWDPEGHYAYHVFQVNDCRRPWDPNDEASSKVVRDCADWTVNGVRVGFQCNYSDKKELNKKCPWFRTH
jgi:hypothetical protein